jgi:anti-sigma factor RsiW
MGHLEERLSAFVDGELAPADHDRVLSHLASCESCRFEVEMLRRLKRRLCGMDAPAPSMDFMGRLSALTTPVPDSDPPDHATLDTRPDDLDDDRRGPFPSPPPLGRRSGHPDDRSGGGGALFRRLRGSGTGRGARYGIAGACMAALTLSSAGLADVADESGGTTTAVEARSQEVSPTPSQTWSVHGHGDFLRILDSGTLPPVEP